MPAAADLFVGFSASEKSELSSLNSGVLPLELRSLLLSLPKRLLDVADRADLGLTDLATSRNKNSAVKAALTPLSVLLKGRYTHYKSKNPARDTVPSGFIVSCTTAIHKLLAATTFSVPEAADFSALVELALPGPPSEQGRPLIPAVTTSPPTGTTAPPTMVTDDFKQ